MTNISPQDLTVAYDLLQRMYARNAFGNTDDTPAELDERLKKVERIQDAIDRVENLMINYI